MNANAIANLGNALANLTTSIIYAATGTPRTTPMLPVNAGPQFINSDLPNNQLKALSGTGRKQGVMPQVRANVTKADDADNKNDKKVDKPVKPEPAPEEQKVKTKPRAKKRRRRKTRKRSNNFGAALLKIWKDLITPSKPVKTKAPQTFPQFQ